MQNMINKPAVLCAEILRGVAELAHAAAAAYGNGKSVQYLTSTGDYASAGSFAELLERASFEKRATARAAAMLRHAGVPQHGVKTALILLDALLSRGTQAGCTEEDWRKVGEMLGYASDCLEQIAAENNLSETAFFVKEGDGYRLRWFTPTEIRPGASLPPGCGRSDLCAGAASSETGRGGRTRRL